MNAAVMALATAGRTAEALCVVRHAEVVLRFGPGGCNDDNKFGVRFGAISKGFAFEEPER